jgi:SAM-dependent methyltransferase
VLHEVYSYNCDSMAAVMQCLRAAWNSLRPGGRIVIRDFVRPRRFEMRVLLIHRRGDMVAGHDFASFALRSPRPVRLDAISPGDAYTYETDLGSACEFILRKDYHELWDFELAERYGFWSLERAEQSLRAAGFRILYTRLLLNEWVSTARISDRILLLEAVTGNPLRLPACQCVIVGEKGHRGSSYRDGN